MKKNETIRLIDFFNKIEIVEQNVTSDDEREKGQLVLIVTYKYQGKEFKTNRLYYSELDKKDAKDIIDYFGSPVYWLDMDVHDWPSQDANLNRTIIKEIAPSDDKEFEKFLRGLANDSKQGALFDIFRNGYWSNYHFNLWNNNHWHDIINLIQAFIKSKGKDVDKKHFSRLVFNWNRHNSEDKRSSLSTHFGGRRFITELQKNIKMVQSELQYEGIKSLLKNNYQIILQGPPGTGKTRLAKELAYTLIMEESLPASEVERNEKLKQLEKSERFKLIQFHPSYSYEDFVRGIIAETVGEKIKYTVKNKVLAEMAAQATNSEKDYVLIIDEINRANLPSVLGELIYALEYRGEEVESMYDLGGPNFRKIILPKNLLIIGTMNTADRSVGNIDYALRRRFAFETILPNKDVVSEMAKGLFSKVTGLFVKGFENGGATASEYLSPDFQFGDVMLGHSYFIGDKETIKDKLKYQVKPLLMEYVKDGVLKEAALSIINGLEI